MPEAPTDPAAERQWDITRRQDIPASVRALLDTLGIPCQSLQVAIPTDIGEEGAFGEKWVLATQDDLITLSPGNGTAQIHLRLALKDFKDFRIDPLVGNAVLEGVTRRGETLEILRYSHALRRQMPQVAKHLQKLAEGAGQDYVPDARVVEDLCPTCGRILQQGSSVCPWCFKKGKTFSRLSRYLFRYRFYVLSVWGLILLATAMDILPPYITKVLIDQVLPAGEHKEMLLAGLVLVLAATRLAAVLIRISQSRLTAIAGTSLTYDIRRDLYAALQRQSLGFYDRRKIGNLMSRMTNDTNMLLSFLTDGVQNVVVNILILVGIGVMLFVMDWRLALYVLLPAPLVVVLTRLIWRKIRVVSYRVSVRWAHLTGLLNDSLSGIRVVKAFGQERKEVRRFDRRSTELFVAGVDSTRLSHTIFPLLAFLTSAGSLIVWWAGGLQVMHHEITLGTLMAFLSYLGMFFGPLQTLTGISAWLSQALTAAERVFEVMDAKPELSQSPHAKRLKTLEGRFDFRHVWFGYDANFPVLKDIDFSVEPGEMIGLVGKSGAGKSTLIHLVCRFYDVTEGEIRVDGTDLRDLSLDDYRKYVGVVLQEPFLFSGSVFENIIYPSPQARLRDVMEAAKMANAHEFVMRLQDGYDAQVGERGHRLSGGERQRISIARAILHDPRILILDEATASVDTQTEKEIQEALSRLIRGRTVFAIAHRLSTLRHASRLVVLDEGRVTEVGTHDELLVRRGMYHRLVQMQMEIGKIKTVGG